jgi:hypothetical protein
MNAHSMMMFNVFVGSNPSQGNRKSDETCQKTLRNTSQETDEVMKPAREIFPIPHWKTEKVTKPTRTLFAKLRKRIRKHIVGLVMT